MNAELRKRFEEAAEKYVTSLQLPSIERTYYAAKEDYLAGTEHGYKEAIAQAKLYLENRLEYKIKIHHKDIEHNVVNEESICLSDFLADFEIDMNKLWEGEK